MTGWLQQFSEIFHGQAGISNYPAHCVRIHGIVPRDGEEYCSVRHHNVLCALADYPKPGFLQSPDRAQVWDARKFGQGLNRNFHFPQQGRLANAFSAAGLNDRGQIFPNGILNILQGFLFGSPLRPAAGQAGTRGGKPLFRGMEYDRVTARHCLTLIVAGFT